MREGWILIFAAPELYQAKLAEDVLKQNGIESHIVSKPDSVIPSLGQAELYTLPDIAEQAMKVLRDHNLIDQMEA
jgi:hypothetical protein